MRTRVKILLAITPVYISYMVIRFAGWDVLATAIICLALSGCIAWAAAQFCRGVKRDD